jgi:hypothetical protein
MAVSSASNSSIYDGKFKNVKNVETKGSYNYGQGGNSTEIYTDSLSGTKYRIHKFTSNGTFTFSSVNKPISVMIVGAGAAGGTYAPGGKGGQVIYQQVASIAPGSYSVVVGTTSSANSSFAGLTALGGQGAAGGTYPVGRGTVGTTVALNGVTDIYGSGGNASCAPTQWGASLPAIQPHAGQGGGGDAFNPANSPGGAGEATFGAGGGSGAGAPGGAGGSGTVWIRYEIGPNEFS